MIGGLCSGAKAKFNKVNENNLANNKVGIFAWFADFNVAERNFLKNNTYGIGSLLLLYIV